MSWKRLTAALIVTAGTVVGLVAGTGVAAADTNARPGPGQTRDYVCAVPVLRDLTSYCGDNALDADGLAFFRCLSRNVVIDPGLPTSPTKIAKLAYLIPTCADDPTHGDEPGLLPW